jgi:hypothetical protein
MKEFVATCRKTKPLVEFTTKALALNAATFITFGTTQ